MFYFLSKVFAFLLMPMGMITVLLVAAWLIRKPFWRRRLLLAALILFLFFSNGVISNELMHVWEMGPTKLPKATRPRAAVVLTGGMINSEVQTPDRITLGDQADRMAQALLLYKSGQIQKIMISGGIGGGFLLRKGADEGKIAARFLQIAGVPAQDILLENRSLNTHENAVFSAAFLKKHLSTYEYVLITSDWHMRRAIGCFKKEKVPVIPYPTGFLSRSRHYTPGHFLPSEQALFNSYWLMREGVGYVVYWIMGYV